MKDASRAVETRVQRHEWDEDACCIHCGFDGAEWWHWKRNTYEGRANTEAKPPLCIERRVETPNVL